MAGHLHCETSTCTNPPTTGKYIDPYPLLKNCSTNQTTQHGCRQTKQHPHHPSQHQISHPPLQPQGTEVPRESPLNAKIPPQSDVKVIPEDPVHLQGNQQDPLDPPPRQRNILPRRQQPRTARRSLRLQL